MEYDGEKHSYKYIVTFPVFYIIFIGFINPNLSIAIILVNSCLMSHCFISYILHRLVLPKKKKKKKKKNNNKKNPSNWTKIRHDKSIEKCKLPKD